MSKVKRNEIIFKLVNKGFTYEKAGSLFGLTKQSIYAINRDFNNKKDTIKTIICVNCGFEAGGDYIGINGYFLFKNDPINICYKCFYTLKKHSDDKENC